MKAARPVRRGDDGKGATSHLASVLPYFLGLADTYEYLTELPLQPVLQARLHEAVRLVRERVRDLPEGEET